MCKARVNEQGDVPLLHADYPAGHRYGLPIRHVLQANGFTSGYPATNIALGMVIVLTVLFICIPPNATTGLLLWSLVAIVVLPIAPRGRGLFFAMLMSEACFGNDEKFGKLTRQPGLAGMPPLRYR